MGCDISWHVERQREDGAWEYVAETPEPVRWYELFSVLAGVRREVGDPPQRFEPQCDLPIDASAEVRAMWEHDERDCFGTSYRTLAEFQAYDWTALQLDECLEAMTALGPPEKVRAIFWFNS